MLLTNMVCYDDGTAVGVCVCIYSGGFSDSVVMNVLVSNVNIKLSLQLW